MTKIILTAFQGKLKSEPMDWDVRLPPDIRMRLDMEPRPVVPWNPDSLPDMVTTRIGRFIRTDKALPVYNSRGGLTTEFATVYVLVDI